MNSMIGIIQIRDYKIHCVVGHYPHERKEDQEIEIDVDLKADFTECVQTDSVEDTINYEQVCRICRDLAESNRYHLLETFAFEALNKLFEHFPLLWARIRVKKKGAIALAKYAAVEMERTI